MKTKQITEGRFEDVRYFVFPSGKERGKIRIVKGNKKLEIPPFPHIKRIVYLRPGLKKAFKKTRFCIEEKVDGYNVRVVLVDGDLYAFTRGGILCPFTTEKIRELDNIKRFLAENPGFVLCGEMAGPNSPYNTQTPDYINYDVDFFAFDIFSLKNNNFLNIPTRDRLLDDYGINKVRSFGFKELSDMDDVEKLVKRWMRRIEGFVFKSEDRRRAVKYVFPESDIEDIESNAFLFPDIGSGYFMQRLARVAFFVDEHNIDPSKYYSKVGKAFLDPILTGIRQIKEGKGGKERFVMIVRNPRTAYDLVSILGRSVPVEVVDLEKRGNEYVVTIEKRYMRTTRFWRERLGGKAFVD